MISAATQLIKLMISAAKLCFPRDREWQVLSPPGMPGKPLSGRRSPTGFLTGLFGNTDGLRGPNPPGHSLEAGPLFSWQSAKYLLKKLDFRLKIDKLGGLSIIIHIMKTSAKFIGLLFAMMLISTCSLQEKEFIPETPDLKSGILAAGNEASLDIKDRYIVVFKNVVSNPAAEAGILRGKFGFEMGHVYEHVFKGFSASIPEQALNGLRNHPFIEYIEQDIIMTANAQTLPTGISRIDADHNLTADIDGTDERVDVDVAIIDTGIDKDHPDLYVVGGVRYYLGFLTDSKYDDDNGHGSHVGGIIGAKDNGEGVVGVAPGARLWAVKVLNSKGSGYVSDIIKGLDWVRARAGDIEVINMSLGGQGSSSSYRTAIQNCVNAGIVVVVAAGNESQDVYGPDGNFGTADDYIPASYPEAAAISAMADSDGQPGGNGPATSYGPDDSFATFSNYSRSVVSTNPVSSPGGAIDLLLPGVSILSCYKDMNYATMSGTSMASPHAAGLAALYIADHIKPTSAAGVYAVRQALINAGKTQVGADGLKVQNDPDSNWENLGWAGTGSAPVNQPPQAAFSYSASGLTVTFTDQSTDDGTIAARSWVFGDGNSSTDPNPSHTYATAGDYSVKLTVTDNGGLTSEKTEMLQVNATDPASLVLEAEPVVLKNGRLRVNLSWKPSSTTADVYRNHILIAAAVEGDNYSDNVKNTGTYYYQVKNGTTWSNEITIVCPVPK